MPTETTPEHKGVRGCLICDGSGYDPLMQVDCECRRHAATAPPAPPAPIPAPAPARTPARRRGTPATDRQLTYIDQLCEERPADHPAVIAARTLRATMGVTKREASDLIDRLHAVPAPNRPPMANRYAGRCLTCRRPVPAQAGEIRRVDGRWQTFHHGC